MEHTTGGSTRGPGSEAQNLATASHRADLLSPSPYPGAEHGPAWEMPGMLWNLVPLLTVIGTALGWWFARRRSA